MTVMTVMSVMAVMAVMAVLPSAIINSTFSPLAALAWNCFSFTAGWRWESSSFWCAQSGLSIQHQWPRQHNHHARDGTAAWIPSQRQQTPFHDVFLLILLFLLYKL